MKQLLIFLLLTLFYTAAHSQLDSIPSFNLIGSIENISTGSKIDCVSVFAINENNDTINIQYTSKNGKYKIMDLDTASIYLIWYKKSGFISKHILIDLKNISKDSINTHRKEITADVNLFENRFSDCRKYFEELEKIPVVKGKIDKQSIDFVWDINYLEKMKKQWDAAIAKAENCTQFKIQEEKLKK